MHTPKCVYSSCIQEAATTGLTHELPYAYPPSDERLTATCVRNYFYSVQSDHISIIKLCFFESFVSLRPHRAICRSLALAICIAQYTS